MTLFRILSEASEELDAWVGYYNTSDRILAQSF